jgi:hypothetical protein
VAERLGVEGVYLGVLEAPAPLIYNGHLDDSTQTGTPDCSSVLSPELLGNNATQ